MDPTQNQIPNDQPQSPPDPQGVMPQQPDMTPSAMPDPGMVTPPPAPGVPVPPPAAPLPDMQPQVTGMPQVGMGQPGQISPVGSGGSMSSGGSNKKVIKLVIIIVVALVVLGGLVFGALKLSSMFAGVKLKEYTSSELGYSINYPADWEVDSSDESSDKSTEFEEKEDPNDKSEDADKLARIKVDYSGADAGIESFDQLVKLTDENIKFLEEAQADSSGSSAKYTVTNKEKTKVGQFDAYLIEFDVENYGNLSGEKGKEAIIFIYIGEKGAYYVDIITHESDQKYMDAAKKIYGSFKAQP